MRAGLKRVLYGRPPAIFGRIPVRGARISNLVIPMSMDYRVSMSVAEWGDNVRLTIDDTFIELPGENVTSGCVPLGVVMKKYSYKYGSKGVAIALDGIRDGVVLYQLAVPAAQVGHHISFTLVAPSAITRVVNVDPTVLMVWSKSVPADARSIAFASGVSSGGVTGPN